MRNAFISLSIAFVLTAGTRAADDKEPSRPSLAENRKLFDEAFNWVQDPAAPKPGGIVLNFAGEQIFLEHAVDDGKGKLDVRRLSGVPFELKEVGGKCVMVLKEKNDKLTDITFKIENDRLIIEDGEVNLYGKTSLKGRWQRWLGDFAVFDNPQGPCPFALVSDQLTGRPLAIVGFNKMPEGKLKYTFVLLFKIPEDTPKSAFGGKSTTGNTNEKASYSYSFPLNGKTFEVDYKAVVDPKTELPTSDVFTVGGIAIKEGETRVVVADMTGEKMVYHKVKIDLPTVKWEMPKVVKRDDSTDWYRPQTWWVAPAMKDIAELKKNSKELQELLKTSPKPKP